MGMGLDPISLGIEGGSALLGLLGQRSHHLAYPTMGPFNFTPNPNDPELLSRRSRLLEDIARSKASTTNEIGRAGLLGSSAGFDTLNQNEATGLRSLDNVTNDVYSKQRQEALDRYNSDLAFRRNLYLQGYTSNLDTQSRSSLLGLQGLGDIGSSFGDQYGRSAYMHHVLNTPNELGGQGPLPWHDIYGALQ